MKNIAGRSGFLRIERLPRAALSLFVFLWLAVSAFTFSFPATAQTMDIKAYICMSDKLAGILPAQPPADMDRSDRKAVAEWQGQNRTGGVFRPAKDKFSLVVRRFEWKDEIPEGSDINPEDSEAVAKFREETCAAEESNLDPVYRSVICSDKAHYTIKLPDEKAGGPVWKETKLVSADKNIFVNSFTVFWLSTDLRYYLAVMTGHYGNYIEEGRCDAFPLQ